MNVTVDNIQFSYKNREVLKGVTFHVPSGSICTLLGANGAGKTTLLKCLNGIHSASGGSVFADGVDLLSLKAKERAKIVGYVPQNAQVGNSNLNVLETVLLGRVPYAKGRFTKQDEAIAYDVLKSFHLEEYAFRNFSHLSGGEKQRVLIARAIAQNPKILLLDEPTSNLDMRFQQETMEIIKSLSERKGITVLTILHDMNLSIVYADLSILLKNGVVFKKGEPKEVLNRENIKSIFSVDVNYASSGDTQYIVPCRKNKNL